jgi:hypothetical protein
LNQWFSKDNSHNPVITRKKKITKFLIVGAHLSSAKLRGIFIFFLPPQLSEFQEIFIFTIKLKKRKKKRKKKGEFFSFSCENW